MLSLDTSALARIASVFLAGSALGAEIEKAQLVPTAFGEVVRPIWGIGALASRLALSSNPYIDALSKTAICVGVEAVTGTLRPCGTTWSYKNGKPICISATVLFLFMLFIFSQMETSVFLIVCTIAVIVMEVSNRTLYHSLFDN